MSCWTHIIAAIDVDTYIESKTIEEDVRNMLKDAPLITGSEGEANIFVNVLPGHNVSMRSDCFHCPHYGGPVYDEEGGFYCDAPSDFKCPEGEYQTRVVITVIGDLRNRMKDQTKREFRQFKKFIKKHINEERGFHIRNCACNIVVW
jgi:hypothetical protein